MDGVAFGGMIVNDVENDFDSGGIRLRTIFELVYHATIAVAGVSRFRREEPIVL